MFCISPSNSQNGYPIERKVIDASGRLGSLYDASTDNLVDQYSAQRAERKVRNQPSVCRLYSGNEHRELISFLRNIDFDGTVRQSLLLQMVMPSGICRVIEYNQPIDDHTRFLYYSYAPRKEKLNVMARKADRIAPAPSGPTKATHMITKILWGFELLCVIQLPRNELANGINRVLYSICNQLKNNEIPVRFHNNDQRFINQLTNIIVYGSELCVDHLQTSISNILRRIPEWQKNRDFHQPLMYTMQPLRWLYKNREFSLPCLLPNSTDSNIAQIEPFIIHLRNRIKELSKIFQNLPTNFSIQILNERLRDLQQHYRFLLDSQENLQERLQKTLVDVRRRRLRPTVLTNITQDQRYECLRTAAMEKFRTDVERLLDKSILIETLRDDRIDYVNARDIRSSERIPATIEVVDAILKRSYYNEHAPVILWYSSDRLHRAQRDRWNEIYRKITEERQHSSGRLNLVYVDFTYFKERLEGFIIVQLPSGRISSILDEHILNKKPGKNERFIGLRSLRDQHVTCLISNSLMPMFLLFE